MEGGLRSPAALMESAATYVGVRVRSERHVGVPDGGVFPYHLRRYVRAHGVHDQTSATGVPLDKGRNVYDCCVHDHPCAPVQYLGGDIARWGRG